MAWTQALDWQGYNLIMTRNESEQETQNGAPLLHAPGAGEISFPALYLFSDGKALHLEAEVNGSKIARVYQEVFWEAQDGWLAGPLCRCELAAPQSKEIGGVDIPIWAENNKLSAIWQPAIRLLISGETAAWAFALSSQSNSNELRLHALWISGKREQSVRLSFSLDGELTRMTVLDRDSASAPRGSRGLLPQPGDQLIPAINWLRRQNGSWQSASGSSNPITVTDQPPKLQSIPAPCGRYHIGLLAHDLDGQPHRGMIASEILAIGLGQG